MNVLTYIYIKKSLYDTVCPSSDEAPSWASERVWDGRRWVGDRMRTEAVLKNAGFWSESDLWWGCLSADAMTKHMAQNVRTDQWKQTNVWVSLRVSLHSLWSHLSLCGPVMDRTGVNKCRKCVDGCLSRLRCAKQPQRVPQILKPFQDLLCRTERGQS